MAIKRTTRVRVAGADDVISWLRWHVGILRFIHINIRGDSPWTPETSASFWKKNKKIILSTYLAQNREKGRPFLRPEIYFAELEEKHPRLKMGTETWMGPLQADGSDRTRIEDVFESDEQYLIRLEVAENWEVDHADKSPKKKKNK